MENKTLVQSYLASNGNSHAVSNTDELNVKETSSDPQKLLPSTGAEASLMEVDNFISADKGSSASISEGEERLIDTTTTSTTTAPESIAKEREMEEDDIRNTNDINKRTDNAFRQTSSPDISIVEHNAAKDSTEELSDSPKGTKRRKIAAQESCCNVECDAKDELISARSFVLSYFQLKYNKGKRQKVCVACYLKAEDHFKDLAKELNTGNALFKCIFPAENETVTIVDSDEDGSDDEEYIQNEDLRIVKDNISSILESALKKIDINFQLDEAERYLNDKIEALEVEISNMNDKAELWQKNLDELREDFYKDYAVRIEMLPEIHITDPDVDDLEVISSTSDNESQSSVKQVAKGGVAMKRVMHIQRGKNPSILQTETDVVAIEQVDVPCKPLPPVGPLTRPQPVSGDVVYVMKNGYFGVWVRAKVIDASSDRGSNGFYTYRVKFDSRKQTSVRNVHGNQIAYTRPCPVRIPVGTRVIALFHDEQTKESFYGGVIAEPPKLNNNYRYLVFFDDGYAQYVNHEKISVVCEQSMKVCDDIHPQAREFVGKYLEQYPERPMVKLQKGQIVKTEWNGKWWIARVAEVDSSLVKMHFDADSRTEWIYRGSTRLGPLYAEVASAATRKDQGSFSRHRSLGIASLKQRNMPYVEYTRTDLEDTKGEQLDSIEDSPKTIPTRAVARKSTGGSKLVENISDNKPDFNPSLEQNVATPGKIETVTISSSLQPKRFRPHQCGPACIEHAKYDEPVMRGHNPLVIPMLCAWRRLVGRYRGKRVVVYKTPCGRRVRNFDELFRYLRITKSNMSVDLFDFDFWVHCFDEFLVDNNFSIFKDISYGAENVPIPCINDIDYSYPDYVAYSTSRIPMEGVPLNLDPEFLVGCDCVDDCQDRTKCSCWQLTIQGSAYISEENAPDSTIGYVYKRLPEPVMTGIYECNSRCKCAKTCLNRVVQHPLQLKLQVFKTEKRGWGIRCLNDIPQGSFICIYAGRLLTEQCANEGGKNYGDEYLAELDYIEVAERIKDGYESDVIEDDDDDTDSQTEKKNPQSSKGSVSSCEAESSQSEYEAENSQDARDSDEDFSVNIYSRGKSSDSSVVPDNSIRTRLRQRTQRSSSEDMSDKGKETHNDKTTKEPDVKGEKKKPVFFDDCITLSDDDEDDEGRTREPSNFSAISKLTTENEKTKQHMSVRELFGKDEACYIMDAKNSGNIGRYLNHSCTPNVFVQSVFVDTHDLRFPWVAFFALTYIRAGTELTWDYNYDIGSVPGKILLCHCGSADCRRRLL